MRPPMRQHIVPALVATLLLASPVGVRAEEADSPEAGPTPATIAEARARFDRGVELFDSSAYEASLAEFYQAYEIAPNYVVLLNIALAYERLDRPARAVETYQRYLDEGGERISADRRADIEAILTRLRRRVGQLAVNASGTDRAVLYLDDVEIGRTPLERPLIVSAGTHIIEVRAEGFHPSRREVIVAGGTMIEVDLELTPITIAATPPPIEVTPPPATPPSRPPLTPRGRTFRTVSYVMAGLAVAALGSAVGLLVWNDGRYDDWQQGEAALGQQLLEADFAGARELEGEVATQRDELDSIGTIDLVGWLLIGLGAAAAATWAALFFAAPREAPSTTARISLIPHQSGAFLSVGFEL